MGAPCPAETHVWRRAALGLGFGAIPLSAQILPALPTLNFDTVVFLLVSIPAWVMAIFTLALWSRSHSRKRLGTTEEDRLAIRPPGASPTEEF